MVAGKPIVRPIVPDDLDALVDLYDQMSSNQVRCPRDQRAKILSAFSRYDGSVILVADLNGQLVASCTLIIIPNLTRGGAPFALIENVVTHAEFRRRGYGTCVLDVATERAWDHGCYKVMLMTGHSDGFTLDFYEAAGFQQSKTGFQKRRPIQ